MNSERQWRLAVAAAIIEIAARDREISGTALKLNSEVFEEAKKICLCNLSSLVITYNRGDFLNYFFF